jgi:hypothetical protein
MSVLSVAEWQRRLAHDRLRSQCQPASQYAVAATLTFMKKARAEKRTKLGTSSFIFALVLGGMTVAVLAWRLTR